MIMERKRLHSVKAFTLVEILVVVVVLTVLAAAVHSLFIGGWKGLDDSMIRSQLRLDSNLIAERLTDDGRGARRAVSVSTAEEKRLTLFDLNDEVLAEYAVIRTGDRGLGILQVGDDSGDDPRVLSGQVNFADTDFVLSGRFLQMNLALAQNTFDRSIGLTTSIEVYFRNQGTANQ